MAAQTVKDNPTRSEIGAWADKASERTRAAAKPIPASHVLAALERGQRAKWWRRAGTKRKGFYYEDVHGRRITDEKHLERIAHLAIPPGYTEVRVSPSARSSLQAVAIDAAGRIQYRYHADFAAAQQKKKYEKIERFGEKLPNLRRTTNEHLASTGLSRERVLAVVVRLINDLYFRLGSEKSVSQYQTYGITSLRNQHLEIKPNGELHFRFVGKHHIQQRRLLVDTDLAAVMREIKAVRGAHLFHYRDEQGKAHPITPRDVNLYIKAAVGSEFSGKDFRTWGGTLLAAITLAELGAAETPSNAKRNLVKAARAVSERLGNTPTVCRDSYIHPVVFNHYLQGVTLDDFRPRRHRPIAHQQPDYLPEEHALLRLFADARKS